MATSIKFLAAVVAAVAAAAAAGCVSENAQRLAEEPNFQVGVGDGCATATNEARSFDRRKQRDAYLFENDEAYRAGWRQGYLSCGDRGLANETDGGLILGQDNEY
ncbi:MAG: hypothetical protein AAGC56_00975 [Pseudomonadota bacterium]